NTYCRSIYVYGTDRFTQRDGCKGIREDYRDPVKEYFAETYDERYLNEALQNGWINQSEYDETKALMTPPTAPEKKTEENPPELPQTDAEAAEKG
ncbi:hypothetical protein, partial [Paenibacillus chitinolyticus]|uniref:hypothetical protein n=1 Tax=Paenibacillus chitinolyticus TaxID=79263 RepID=UPI00295E3D39